MNRMKSLSVVIPAYNEEQNLVPTVEAVVRAAEPLGLDYEIIIVNDCSRDRTGVIAEALAAKNHRVRVMHNETNSGLGFNFRKGIAAATKEHVAMVPGDNAFYAETLTALFGGIGKANIVNGWTMNQEVRPMGRRIVSWLFTNGMNLLFGQHLRYFNGPCVFRTADAKLVPMTTSGFSYMSEMLLRLLTSGRSITEVGLVLHERKSGASNAFHTKNIISVFETVFRLFWEVRVLRRQVPKIAQCAIISAK